ncbi:enoyl-CoA hydratase/isomerase family protein [uncultured Desulfosarcina sp.]|uniref:enoyl-CoA hydratase/isomerase family protein n=1 Tax=uncultured Desulfosarcina sp. TaxID=218289 RepID=UPI0029C6AF87|nr:enoyl-CoA hydratase/isomerase family protein [uncultured Desulfosarcina sp.]
MRSEGVFLERRGALAVLVLRRPGRLNACNREMFIQLEAAAGELAEEPLPRAVIVTGEGSDAFCSGFDVNPDNPMVAQMAQALEKGDPRPIEDAIAAIRRAVDRLAALPAPIIAAINGKAFGGGAELAVRCDLRVMDPAAVICFSEVRLGLMPDWGGGATLTHLIGSAAAADLILTARKVGAHEALQLGLVNRVSAPGKAVEEAVQLAEAIMANGPRAVKSALKVIRAGRNLTLEATLDLERTTAVDLIASGECLHGIGAFLNGKEPDFPDLPVKPD